MSTTWWSTRCAAGVPVGPSHVVEQLRLELWAARLRPASAVGRSDCRVGRLGRYWTSVHLPAAERKSCGACTAAARGRPVKLDAKTVDRLQRLRSHLLSGILSSNRGPEKVPLSGRARRSRTLEVGAGALAGTLPAVDGLHKPAGVTMHFCLGQIPIGIVGQFAIGLGQSTLVPVPQHRSIRKRPPAGEAAE